MWKRPFSSSSSSALEKLREEFKADNESLAQSEAISILSLVDDLPNDDDDIGGEDPVRKSSSNNKANGNNNNNSSHNNGGGEDKRNGEV